MLVRCYAHLTQHRIPSSHALYAQVESGSISAVDGCMSLLEDAALETAGGSAGRLKNENSITKGTDAKRVLKSFNDLHRTFFGSDDISASVPEGEEHTVHTREVYDGGEPALHLTRALFWPDAKVSELVTMTSSMESLRSSGPRSDDQDIIPPLANGTKRRFRESTQYGYAPGDGTLLTYTQRFATPLEGLQIGTLLGVRPISLNSAKHNRTALSGYTIPFNTDPGAGTPDANQTFQNPIYIHRSLGGGVVGSRSYLMLNFGRANYEFNTGGTILPRRWAKSIYKDLLCRDLPVVRSSDATPYVQTSTTANTPPFRTSRTCMQCHSTMDPLAEVARNLNFVPVPYQIINPNTVDPSFVTLYEWPQSLPREVGLVDLDTNFRKRPPYGNLFFRSLKGELVNKEVLGFGELGTALSETEDLYACLASRYLFYFTGIAVPLQDPGEADANLSSLTDADRLYRNMVLDLGSRLKQDQSLKNLIRRILESSLYRTSSMRDASDEAGDVQ